MVFLGGMLLGCALSDSPTALALPENSSRSLVVSAEWNLAGSWTFDNSSTFWPNPEMYHKTMTLSKAADGTYTGSGASVPAYHLFAIEATATGNVVSITLAYSTIANYKAVLAGTIKDDG